MLDIDDTLIDYTNAEKTASIEFGKRFSSEIPDYDSSSFPDIWHLYMEKYYQKFLSGEISYFDQRRNRIREIFKNPKINDKQADEIYSVYKQLYKDNWKLFDDVIPFLEKYKDNGYVAITDGQEEQQKEKLVKTGIMKYFKNIIAAETVMSSKPNLRIFQAALDSEKLKAEQCIYIGDNLEKDAMGSKNAGMIGIWLKYKTKGNNS